MFFWNSLAFSMIQQILAIWFLVPLPFLNPACDIWKFSVHTLLKPSLKNFEHYIASMWNEYNYSVVWTFFDIAFLWDWNENSTQKTPRENSPAESNQTPEPWEILFLFHITKFWGGWLPNRDWSIFYSRLYPAPWVASAPQNLCSKSTCSLGPPAQQAPLASPWA